MAMRSVTVHLNDCCGSLFSSFLRIQACNSYEVDTFFHRFLHHLFTVGLPFTWHIRFDHPIRL